MASSYLQDYNPPDGSTSDADFIKSEAGKNVLIALTGVSFLCLVLGLYNTALMLMNWRKKFEVLAVQAKVDQFQSYY